MNPPQVDISREYTLTYQVQAFSDRVRSKLAGQLPRLMQEGQERVVNIYNTANKSRMEKIAVHKRQGLFTSRGKLRDTLTYARGINLDVEG